jgi:hypothetical protein
MCEVVAGGGDCGLYMGWEINPRNPRRFPQPVHYD